jgi:ABC-type dipeptide/oligopeptide/nickel transport system permease component
MSVAALLGRRAVHTVLVIAGVLTIVFLLSHLSGDPTALFVSPGASQHEVAVVRHEYGFDKSLWQQYRVFVSDALFHGFGPSLRYQQTALRTVLERLPATLSLAGLAFAMIVAFALPLGMLAAIKRGSWIDGLATTIAAAGLAMPAFWVGIILILMFAVHLGYFPTSGAGGFKALVLPALTLAVNGMGMATRMVRSAMAETLSQDYIRTAISKGVSRRKLYGLHALKNALIPVLTILGLQVPILLGGAVITEEVFAYPGMARLATESVLNRDFPVVEAFVFVAALLVLTTNLILDLVYAWVDPRIRDATMGS